MKSIYIYIITSLFLIALIMGMSENIMKELTTYRWNSTNPIFSSDRYRYGDLYGLSHLNSFKHKNIFAKSNIPLLKIDTNRFINLYVVGDSYLAPSFIKNESDLYGVKKYFYLRHNDPNSHKLKYNETLIKGEKNILLIEFNERGLRKLDELNYIINRFDINTQSKEQSKNALLDKFKPLINQNLEFILFDLRLFTPFKEAKAFINYKCFDRIADEVTISPDKKYLLHKSTVDSLSFQSSFCKIKNVEIDRIVNTLNYTYDYYKSKGFDEVYFTIIPNPVTILYPKIGHYNELIPRIQMHENLKPSIINIYDIFRRTKIQIYCKSDSHWNKNGFNLWLNEFNKKLIAEYKN